jgi:Flp pilus assembly protein TadD
VEPEAADVRFAERQREVEADPDDWAAWFRLAVAYDDAGDRRRARSAMRSAIERYDPHTSGG